MNGFADTARRARVEKRMSLRALAERLGLSVIYISDMETGRRVPPAAEIAIAWAKALDFDENEFVELALRDKKMIELPLEGRNGRKIDVAVMLARSWDNLTTDQQNELAEAFRRIVPENG